jgi:hypothetical protein
MTCGLLRKDGTTKPAYERIRGLIKNEWQSETKGVTDRSGVMESYGFTGRWKVTARVNSQELAGEFILGDRNNQTITVVLE